MAIEQEQIGACTLYRGDCREVRDDLYADAVVSDPPYGMQWDGRITRGPNGTGTTGPTRHYGCTMAGDAASFDPRPWLHYAEVLLWGFHHFPQALHRGSVLVWLKRYDQGFHSFLSDADVAWLSTGHGVYCQRDLSLQSNAHLRHHPTEKPLGIMRWCLSFIDGQTVLDPFMGSGTTGVACVQLGRSFIGIEIEPRYFDIACQRITAAYAQPDLFVPKPSRPMQQALFAHGGA